MSKPPQRLDLPPQQVLIDDRIGIVGAGDLQRNPRVFSLRVARQIDLRRCAMPGKQPFNSKPSQNESGTFQPSQGLSSSEGVRSGLNDFSCLSAISVRMLSIMSTLFGRWALWGRIGTTGAGRLLPLAG